MGHKKQEGSETTSGASSKRSKALAKLGLAAFIVYMTPALLKFEPAHASRPPGRNSARGAAGHAANPGVNYIGDALTRKECGECHEAFGSENLPAATWRRMMKKKSLLDHFGDDASLAEPTRLHIEKVLVRGAKGKGDGPLRITKTYWFKRKHMDITDPARKGWGSCKSCHAATKF